MSTNPYLSFSCYSSNVTSNPRPLSSCINTLNDSGNPGSGIASPFTESFGLGAGGKMGSVSFGIKTIILPYWFTVPINMIYWHGLTALCGDEYNWRFTTFADWHNQYSILIPGIFC